jgi:oxygen-independent coproporphyrinogen-3 oxidase
MQPTHISWYQLTIEPKTLFAVKTPTLPNEQTLEEIETLGKKLLASVGFDQYEVSAYAKNSKQSVHNSNYWIFGDYIGIGAGAHSKITNLESKKVKRAWKQKHPKIYTQADKLIQGQSTLSKDDLIYEFMLNALRLKNGFDLDTFRQQTFLDVDVLSTKIEHGITKGLLEKSDNHIKPTDKGYLFLNDCVNLFV